MRYSLILSVYFVSVLLSFFSTFLLDLEPRDRLDCSRNHMQWHKSLSYSKRIETLVSCS